MIDDSKSITVTIECKDKDTREFFQIMISDFLKIMRFNVESSLQKSPFYLKAEDFKDVKITVK